MTEKPNQPPQEQPKGQEDTPRSLLAQGVPFEYYQGQTKLILDAISRVEKAQTQFSANNRDDHRLLFNKIDAVSAGVSDLRTRVVRLEGEVVDLHEAKGKHSKEIHDLRTCVNGVGRKMNGISYKVEFGDWKQKWLWIGVGAVLLFILSLIVKTLWPDVPFPK